MRLACPTAISNSIRRIGGDVMKHRLTVAVVLAMVAGLFTASAAVAAAESDHAKPFKGTWSGSFELVLDGDWCDETGLLPVVIYVEQGQATHLGRFTGEARHCTNNETGEFVDGVVVMIAANGDELHGTYAGAFLPDLPDGTSRTTGLHEYDGGTGRFANATGDAAEGSRFVFTSETEGVIWGTLAGTLSYDASDRRN
jgi:hypothetical protein